jgi:cell wall-associated NlpC family hydrolase
MNWASRYVGLPFDPRNVKGPHCWGLVCRVFAEQRGIVLPEHGEFTADDMVEMARAAHEQIALPEIWRPVPRGQEREFDVAVMMGWVAYGDGSRRREINHVGVITSDRSVLHVERATAAVLAPLDHPTIRSRYGGAYRYARVT